MQQQQGGAQGDVVGHLGVESNLVLNGGAAHELGGWFDQHPQQQQQQREGQQGQLQQQEEGADAGAVGALEEELGRVREQVSRRAVCDSLKFVRCASRWACCGWC